jgi:hypothetical protein
MMIEGALKVRSGLEARTDENAMLLSHWIVVDGRREWLAEVDKDQDGMDIVRILAI